MSQFFRVIQLGFIAFLLSSCSSSVENLTSGYQYQGEKFKTAMVTVQPELQAKLADTGFSTDEMATAITRKLRDSQLLDETAPYSLQIDVDDVRIRSLITAMAFAFFAGDDHIRGNVSILDSSRSPMKTFRVSTSFALGGIFNSEGDVRWDWLYNKFAQQVVAGILQ